MRYRQRESKAVSAWIADSDYTHGGEVVCGLRHVYRGVWGCPAWRAGEPCSHCFLGGTVRGQRELLEGVAWGKPLGDCEGCGWHEADGSCRCSECGLPIDVAPARAAVEKWLSEAGEPECCNLGDCDKPHFDPLGDECLTCDNLGHTLRVLNAGEYTDSLAWTPEENPHLGMLLDLFSDPETNPYGQKLLLVSKAGLETTEAHLEGRQPSENVILSFSIGNLGEDAEPHWLPAFYPGSRLVAAARMLQRGWRVRLRLDPLGPGHDWQADVEQYAKTTIAHFVPTFEENPLPELITLGTLRHNGGRVMLPADERASIYHSAIDGLRNGGYEGPIGLCKETPEMVRSVLRIEPHEMRCNCLP